MKKIILFILLIISLIGCGNEPPVILSVKHNILIYQSKSFNNPEDMIFLSVYFILDDDNGFEDIREVKIIHSATEYSWVLPVEILKSSTIWEEKKYTGYPFLEFDNAKSVLTGEYLIEAVDSVGNAAETFFFVEVEGLISSEPFKLPAINYNIEAVNKNREIKILGDRYASCEIKFPDDPKFFDGGRKKIDSGKKIILNDNKSIAPNTKLSVRVNKDENESIIYFLKTFELK